MSKAGKRPMRSLTAHEKLDAIRRVHEGESKASVARDIGVPESTLRGWCKNEDKISYLSRQSSPEADESTSGVEPKEKKPKLEEVLQPYNLSKKANGVSTLSPNADYTKTDFNGTKPLNLNIKNDNYKTNSSAASMTDRNKAELARLSVDLRLNQPETFIPTNMNSVSANTLTDLTSNMNLLAAHWSTMMLQHQQKSQSNYKITAPTDASNGSMGSYPIQSRLENGHISRYKTHKSSKVSDRQSMIDESLLYWFKTQSMLGLMQNQHNGLLTTAPVSTVASTTNTSPNYSNITTASASTISPNYANHTSIATNITNNVSNITTTTTAATTTTATTIVTSPSTNTPNVTIASNTTPTVTNTSNAYNDIHNNFKFWQWYKNDVDLYGLQQTQKFQEKPILYHQLTKTAKENGHIETNIHNDKIENDSKDKHNDSTKEGRCLLDDLLRINNNNNNVAAGDAQNDAQENILSQNEGLMHGEKFLKYLECCGDPMVTQVHILQLRYLLNNIKNGVDKKSGDLRSKCKVRRK